MEEEVVNKKTEEGNKKNRTSLKSILGGDILATDFFRRQTKLLLTGITIVNVEDDEYHDKYQQLRLTAEKIGSQNVST